MHSYMMEGFKWNAADRNPDIDLKRFHPFCAVGLICVHLLHFSPVSLILIPGTSEVLEKKKNELCLQPLVKVLVSIILLN